MKTKLDKTLYSIRRYH